MVEKLNKVEVPCPVCSSINFKIKYPDTLGNRLPTFNYNFERGTSTYRLVKCVNCTHQYASPLPVNLYEGYSGNISDDIYLEQQDNRTTTAKKVLKKITKYKDGGRLLDVGCATGDFLVVAKSFYQTEGLELSEWSTNIARKRGLTIHNKLLSEMAQSEKKYDVITLWGVIEHFEKPYDEIINISHLLNKDGLVCLWTGNVQSILALLLGKKWWYYQGQHIQMFTANSICQLFESIGFKKIHLGLYPYQLSAKTLSNSLSRYPSIFRLISPVLKTVLLSQMTFTLKLPGEMFAIFQLEDSA